MNNYNRRDFISSVSKGLIGCSLCPSVALCDDFYEDIVAGKDVYCFGKRVDNKQLFSGGKLITLLRNSFYVYEKFNQLDTGFDKFSLTVNKTDGGKCKLRVYEYSSDWEKYHEINVTSDWCRKFYKIHRNDDLITLHAKQLNVMNDIIDYHSHHKEPHLDIKEHLEFHKKGQKQLMDYLNSNTKKLSNRINNLDCFCFLYYSDEWDKIECFYDYCPIVRI